MNLYTIIAEWKEGTYISQVITADELLAVAHWLQQVETQPIKGLGPAMRRKLAEKISEGEVLPVALNGLTNSWCATALIRNSLLLLHLIMTVPAHNLNVG